MLDDGTVFRGHPFGYERPVAGEAVFDAAMAGYPESLADPSYAGQLMTLTYPLVGNCSAPPRTFKLDGITTFMGGERTHTEAIIVSDYSYEYSHWNVECGLGDRLKEEKIPGIHGISTRALTKKLRKHGAMMGRIVIGDTDNETGNGELKTENYGYMDYVDRISCRKIICYLPDSTNQAYSLSEASNPRFSIFSSQFLKRIALLDCGVKRNIIRCPLRRNVAAIRMSWDYDFNQLECDSLSISNGSGGSDTCNAIARSIRRTLFGDKPICGIRIGNQLLAKAGGASIYKLKYGHRSHNQPVCIIGTKRCFTTSQSRGYTADNNTLGEEWKPLFTDMNDGMSGDIKHKMKPSFSSQFHPEACSGPLDTEFMFNKFTELLWPGIYAHSKRGIRTTLDECLSLPQASV